jgi:hypothetical protein
MARGRDKAPQGITSVEAITWHVKPSTSVDTPRGYTNPAPRRCHGSKQSKMLTVDPTELLDNADGRRA